MYRNWSNNDCLKTMLKLKLMKIHHLILKKKIGESLKLFLSLSISTLKIILLTFLTLFFTRLLRFNKHFSFKI